MEGFILPSALSWNDNVLARLFCGKMMAMLMDAHDRGQLTFFNTHAGLAKRGRSSTSSPRCGAFAG